MRSAHLLVVTALLGLLAVAALVHGAEAQTDPPSSGDWTVSDTTVVWNRTVDLMGNLTVTAGGDLTLRNVTLRVQSFISVTHGILVQAGGALVIEDLDGDPLTDADRSVVMRGVPSRGYFFVAERGAVLAINRSLISGPGEQGTPSRGLLVKANGTYVESCTILDGDEYGLRAEGCSDLLIKASHFARANDGLALVGAVSSRVQTSSFVDNARNGVYLFNATDTEILFCNLSSNRLRGLHARMGRGLDILNTVLHDNFRGMVVEGTVNVSVLDGDISDTSLEAVSLLPGTRNVSLYNVDISEAGRSGILAEGVSGLYVDTCWLFNCSYYGVRVFNDSANISFIDVDILNSSYDGINIERSTNIYIETCTLRNNGYNGIFLTDCMTVLVRGCGISMNRYNGVNTDNTEGIIFRWNSISSNDYHGIFLQANTRGALVDDSLLSNNTRAGLACDSVQDVTVTNTYSVMNTGDGIRIESGSADINISHTRLWDNAESALYIDRSHGIHVENCTLRSTQEPNRYALSVSRGGDVWVMNSTVNGTVRAESDGNVTFVDPDVLAWSIFVGTDSWVDLAYWVNVTVVWPDMTPVRRALVNITSVDGNRTVSVTTDGSGLAAYVPVTNVTWDSTHVPYADRNPHTFRASKGETVTSEVHQVRHNIDLVIVLLDDEPPVARTADVVAELGSETELDGSLSTDNGDIAYHLWTFDDGIGTVVLEGARVSWTFTNLGTFAGELNVTDSVGQWHAVTFNISVVDTTPPNVSVGEDVTTGQNEQVQLDGRGTTDNDGTLLTTGGFVWVVYEDAGWVPLGQREGPLKTWNFPEMGLYRVVLTVTDQSGNSANATLVVVVRDTEPPTVELGPDLEVDQGELVVVAPLELADNDPGFNGTLSVWWTVTGPDMYRLDQNGSVLEWTPVEMGDYVVTVLVFDRGLNSATDRLEVLVRDVRPPEASAGSGSTVEMGAEVNLSGAGSRDNDPDFPGGALFRWTIRGPDLDITRNGVNASFEPPWVGEYVCTLSVTDAAGNVGTDEVVVTSVDTSPPLFEAFSPGPGELSDSPLVTIRLTVVDAGTGLDPSRVLWRMAPPGTGLQWLEWRNWTGAGAGNRVELTADEVLAYGTTRLQFQVFDRAGNGPVTSPVYVVRVNTPPVALILSPSDGADYGPYDVITLDASGSHDPDEEDTLTYTWWSSIDGAIGFGERMSSPRLSSGDHRIVLTVSDGVAGHDVTQEVSINVRPVPSTITDGSEFPWFWVLLLILAALLLLAVLVERRRRAGPAPEPPVDEPVGETADETPDEPAVEPVEDGRSAGDWEPIEEVDEDAGGG